MKTGQQMHAWWNRDEVVEVGVGGGDTKQSGQTGPNIWKRGHFNTNPSSPSSSSTREMGVKPKTGNSTLTQKRANVNNQMNDT